MKSSVRAARLSLDTNCSLLISSISAEDAGLYTCRQRETKTSLYLHVLTISRYLPEADLTGDGEVILRCFLLKYSELLPCAENSLRWVDETGAELQGKGVGYEIIAQKNCASFLTYKHQRGHTRRDTCRFVEESIVKIQADYTPVLTKPDSAWSPLSYVMLSLRLAALLLTTLVVFLLLRDRGNMASLAVNSVKNEGDEVKYENVDAASSLH
ncbi:uncharacterized protein [Trachinotus anak]|uniref:uncharacterized protein n=1 Tax=Trachinotus anak TaxID=443729 RepID=UPI0039F193E6